MSAGVMRADAWVQTKHLLLSGLQLAMPVEWGLALNHGRRTAPSLRPGYEKVDWHFHQAVIDDLTQALRGAGVTVITEVDLVSISGRTARAEAGFEPPENPELMQLLIRGWRSQPVTSATEAETYAQAAVGHIYGPEAARLQAPFHAQATDHGWRVEGSRPWNIHEWYSSGGAGPITLILDRDGTIRNVYFTSGLTAPPLRP